MVRLDRRGDSLGPTGLDDVAVQRPLHEPLDVAEPPCLLLEDADELAADDLALLLRVLDAGEELEEPVLRLHVDERHVEVLAERLHHLLGLVLAQEPVVDEHTRELVADRLVHDQRRDRRVHAAGERAEDALGADLPADAVDLLLDDRRRRPRRARARDYEKEVLQHLHPVLRVHDFGMELHAVHASRFVLERGDGSRVGARRDGRSFGRGDDGVAVAHPDRLLGRKVARERAALHPEGCSPELGRARPVDAAAEVERHQLRAVADAERRDPELEDARVDARRVLGVHRRWAAAEDDRVRVAGANRLR